MNWKKRILKTVSYILVAALASAATLFVWGARQESDKLAELQQVIDHYFVGEADMEYARDVAAAALVDGLGDQWSYYIPASEMSAHQEYKENSTVAIGVNIAVREDNTGIDIFENTIKNMFFEGELKHNDEITITNLRHKEALQSALDSLKMVRRSIDDGMEEDFYSIDLMSAYAELGKIIGEEVGEDLVDEIFSKFCMGK